MAAEPYQDDLAQEEEVQAQQESTVPWTVMLIIALVFQVVTIVMAWMELSDFYKV